MGAVPLRLAVRDDDVFLLLRPAIDAHTLGISAAEQLLRDCGHKVIAADAVLCEAICNPSRPDVFARVERFIRQHGVTRLGVSYRLDPRDGAAIFGRLMYQLRNKNLLAEKGGPLRAVYFAGLPGTCELVKSEHGDIVGVFCGDETVSETLDKFGVSPSRWPRAMSEQIGYDDARLDFARQLLRSEKHLAIRPVDRSSCEGFGTRGDRVVTRIRHGQKQGSPPLMRAHVGPYEPNRVDAVHRFIEWTRRLAQTGLLDVLSVGTSQLTQSNFGEPWGDRPNGGGVPINSPEEFRAVWDAARPMLVRTYAGTQNIPVLARMYEETIDIAWHALSLWWFCRVDGRGPYTVYENLRQHVDALRWIGQSNKPYEPNVSHHFAFRGGDDVTYVVSAVLAARTAKRHGIRQLILQNMLNTPKYTWGIADLAKSRAMLGLVRELEDDDFEVFLQPRAGLDYFSHDLEKAKVQLASVSALMDDIEPRDSASPPIVHVVSYSEASHLADPTVINESIQITRAAIQEYRRLRVLGEVDDMTRHVEVVCRTEELLEEARAVLAAIEESIPSPYSAAGLYQVFAAGFLLAPYLWGCRDEFDDAIRSPTRLIRGAVKVVDQSGIPIPSATRAAALADVLKAVPIVMGVYK